MVDERSAARAGEERGGVGARRPEARARAAAERRQLPASGAAGAGRVRRRQQQPGVLRLAHGRQLLHARRRRLQRRARGARRRGARRRGGGLRRRIAEPGLDRGDPRVPRDHLERRRDVRPRLRRAGQRRHPIGLERLQRDRPTTSGATTRSTRATSSTSARSSTTRATPSRRRSSSTCMARRSAVRSCATGISSSAASRASGNGSSRRRRRPCRTPR